MARETRAIIRKSDNKVINVIVVKENFDHEHPSFPAGAGNFLGPDGAKKGDTWNGTDYETPPKGPPGGGSGKPKGSDVDSEKSRRKQAGFTKRIKPRGPPVRIDTSDQEQINRVLGLSIKGLHSLIKKDHKAFLFTDVNEVEHEIEPQQAIDLGIEMEEFFDKIENKARELKKGQIPDDYRNNKHWD